MCLYFCIPIPNKDDNLTEIYVSMVLHAAGEITHNLSTI